MGHETAGSNEGEPKRETKAERRLKARDARKLSPIIATIRGIRVVTIPFSHYADLLQGRPGIRDLPPASGLPATPTERAALSPAQLAAHAGSPIYLDREVANFLYGEVGRSTAVEAGSMCRDRYGAERTPSKSAISRYWARVRAMEGQIERDRRD